MPSDSNGVYSLPSGYLAVTGEVIQASQHNPPLEDLASAMSARLMRSGAAAMTGPIKVVDGSAGSPAVQFANASSTGIFKTTNGIGVSIGGTQVAEFGAGGLTRGGKFIGEVFIWTGATAPSLCVLPYGQTLSRTAYPDLWTFAQAQIAIGNVFYNNGNGTTTFGIGDLRGRTVAGKDDIGGTPAGRITVGNFGATPNLIGSVGGLESIALTTAQLAAHTHINTLSDPGHSHGGVLVSTNGYNSPGGATTVVQSANGGSTSSAPTGITITNASAGSGNAHNNMQPTLLLNFALFAGA